VKFTILGIIIAVHLVILGFLFGPCRPDRQKTAEGADTTAGQGAETPDGGATEDEPPAAASDASYRPSFYTDALAPLPAGIQAAARDCKAGVVVDWSARTVLWKKADETATPIASLTKMMTVLMVMEALEKDPQLTLKTPVRVTKQASGIGGREVWLDTHETFTIDELLKCTLIFSANDAAYLLGQFLAGGDMRTFVSRMNRRAKELGMTHFTFHNPNGLPEGAKRLENTGCVREISYLAGRLLEYPDVLKWSGTRVEHLESPRRSPPTLLTTTNKLLGHVRGVNGMKTGYTDAAGWCMAATCNRDGRVVIVVLVGCSDSKARNALATQLIGWAYGGK
jgi:D-alanyl-D-alanine carboxypeptidase (penicillin-binding protein 5/6)